MTSKSRSLISLMLAVPDAPAAEPVGKPSTFLRTKSQSKRTGSGAGPSGSFGGGIEGRAEDVLVLTPFPNLPDVLTMKNGRKVTTPEPERNGWETPEKLGAPSARVEVFCDDPDAFIARALAAGANGSLDRIRDHQMPWGTHRQGGFIDPFGHKWLVGDRSPLKRHS